MLASTFIVGGVASLRDPGPRVPPAEKVVGPLKDSGLPGDTEQLVKVNGAIHVGAGLLLALGRAPRLSSLALAGTLVPTTLAGHRYWEESDPAAKASQRFHFWKNVSLIGGLLIAAVDTEGRPSLGWRARKAAKRSSQVAGAAAAVGRKKAGGGSSSSDSGSTSKRAARKAAGTAKNVGLQAADVVRHGQELAASTLSH